MKNLIDIQEQTIHAVEHAALFVQQEMGKIRQSDIETKSLNSLVTYVDKESEKIFSVNHDCSYLLCNGSH